jgi:hypothetical protein
MNPTRILPLLFLATSLAADPLADVRTALGRFPARESVRATYELQHSVKNEGKFGNDNFSGKIAVDLEASAAGYHIVVGRPLLDQIEREQQARDRNPKLNKPARILILRAADRMDPDDAGKVKVAENKVTLWLDAENVPLAVEHLFTAKFSVLFLKGEMKEKKSWHLGRAADRLVRARFESTQNSSGMGQKGNESVVATVRVH